MTVEVTPVPDAPVAVDDAGPGFETTWDASLLTGNVLDNDSDADGDPLTIDALLTGTTRGAVTDNGDGTFAYDPAGAFDALRAGESVLDRFDYRVSDGQGGTATATIGILVSGTQSEVVGTDDDAVLPGTEGNDLFRPGAGLETLLLGLGRDLVAGAAADLFGDRIEGFAEGDGLLLEGLALSRDFLAFTPGMPGTLDIDADRDGTPDGQIAFTGDFSGGDFMAALLETGTLVSFVPFLADLAEGQPLPEGMVNGIVNADFLNGQNAAGLTASFAPGAEAGFDNTVGYYEIDPEGNLLNPTILAANAKDATGPITITVSDPDNDIGFFLVADGANRIDASVFAADDFSFVSDETGGVDLAAGGMVLTDIDLYFSHDAALNPDGQVHVVSGVSDDGEGALVIGFEDLSRSDGSDDDFQDVILYVDAV